jgi:O-acetyl-ADP-ribose deacetylase (regulator of RNase III)
MIEYVQGDLLDADAEALVNAVNLAGVMGKGVALAFRQRFPENFESYRDACQRGELVMGRMFVHFTGTLENPRYIVNFPTKRHWRSRSRLADIELGLEDLRRVAQVNGFKSMAVPALGCGQGGLNWSDVRPLIEAALAGDQVRTLVYQPRGPATH